VKMRARPLAWRKVKGGRECRGGERFGLIIVGGSKSEQVEPLSRILLSGDEWENGLVVECAVAERAGCLAEWSAGNERRVRSGRSLW